MAWEAGEVPAPVQAGERAHPRGDPGRHRPKLGGAPGALGRGV